MSSAVIGALRVNLGLDSARFTKGINDVQARLQRAQKQFLAVAGGAAALAGALTTLTIKAAANANEISRLSQVSNALPEQFQAWAAGARTVGIEQDKLADILKDTNDRIGDFVTTGGGPMADFFENIAPKVGVTADQFARLSGPEALQLYVSSLQDAGASQQEMTFYMEALASDATLLLPLLADNGAEMQRLADNARDLGGVLSNESIAALKQADQAVRDLRTAVSGAADRIAAAFAPSLTAMATGLTKAMREGGSLRIVLDALANNIERIITYATTAAAAFAGRYVAAFVAARVATMSLVGSLVALRAALLRTGIGILIVGAGEAVYQFSKLVKSTGSFGNAMEVLGRLAGAVWQGIIESAKAIPPALEGVWQSMKAGFFAALADMATKFHDFIWMIGNNFQSIPGLEGIGDQFIAVAEQVSDASGNIMEASGEAESAASSAFSRSAETISGAFDPVRAIIAELNETVSETADEADNTATSVDGLNDALDDTGGGSGGGAAGKAAKAIEAAKTQAEGFKAALDEAAISAEDMGRAKADIMIGGIDGVSNAIGEFASSGLRDFKSLSNSALDTFKGMLSQMIALAAKNRIMISMGIGGSGGGSGIGSMMGALGGGGAGSPAMQQALGNILPGAGGVGLGASFMGGLGSVFSGITSGGLAGGAGAIGTALGGATSSMAGLATAAGAIALPVAAAVAAVSFFSTKTKEVGSSLRLTADGASLAVDEIQKLEKSRFWGLQKKTVTNINEVADSISGPLAEAYGEIFTGVQAQASALNISSAALARHTAQIRINTKDMSEQEVQQAAINALQGEQEALASRAIDAIKGQSDILRRAGETSVETLDRLNVSMSAVNQTMDALGLAAFQFNAYGMANASALLDAAGGVQALSSNAQAFYQMAYSEEERRNDAFQQVRDVVRDLGVRDVPRTAEAFRKLLETFRGAGDGEAVGSLLSAVPAFQSYLQLTDSLNASQQAAKDAAQAIRDQAAAEKARAAEDFARRVGAGRSAYTLDASRFQTEFEAKFAQEIAADRDQAVIEEQNRILRKNNELLTTVVNELRKGNRVSADAMIQASIT